MITKLMLIKKDVKDFVLIGPYPKQQNPMLWKKEVKEDYIAVKIACQIIIEEVNNQIAFNIMDLEDLKKMLDKLTSICSKIGQGVVYSILQELFNYPKINKPKEYDKLVMQIFTKVQYICKCFCTAITLRRDL